MSHPISVEHVSKIYRLGTIGAATLQDDFSRAWARLLGRPDPLLRVGQVHERLSGGQLWALDDVSFQVEEGEILGIIGRNGAGKSTLLKILSQVTSPTSGQIRIMGRVASLLEVGTGFHPDLTGRENVFLNGAIMGMRKAEVHRKFEEIVEFSECSEFIDTPVKRYSSGMYVRLAFAVAAHLEPEILIIDEVLAVGDAQFQKKCLQKMGEVSRGGRTVLFVSHNMGAVRNLCQRAVVLSQGKVLADAYTEEAVSAYLGRSRQTPGVWSRPDDDHEPKTAYVQRIEVINNAGTVTGVVRSTDAFTIRVTVGAPAQTPPAQLCVRVTNQDGILVFSSASSDQTGLLTPIASGLHVYELDVPSDFLAAGFYNVWVLPQIPRVVAFDSIDELSFSVEDTSHSVKDTRVGVVAPKMKWRHSLESADVHETR